MSSPPAASEAILREARAKARPAPPASHDPRSTGWTPQLWAWLGRDGESLALLRDGQVVHRLRLGPAGAACRSKPAPPATAAGMPRCRRSACRPCATRSHTR